MNALTALPSPDAGFAELLRHWRHTRGMSQMSLALATAVSARHLGFLELGRSGPSRAMVMGLAHALDVPLRARNQLLVAAGYAPMYRETPLGDPTLAPVRDALSFMLAASEPHPCFVVDRRYGVSMANTTGRWLLATFTTDAALVDGDVNLVRVLTEPGGMAPFIVNRDEVLRKVLGRVRRDLGQARARSPADDETLAMADAAWSTLSGALKPDAVPPATVGLQLQRDNVRLDLFTVIATLGTPLDVTLQELRIETFFPTDESTRFVLAARWEASRTAG